MSKLKTSDLVNIIAQLDLRKSYSYYTGNTKLKITEITKPEGPINFIRWRKNETEANAGKGTVSTAQLATVASVFSGKPNYPIHLDRLFSAGGNSRSALETLLVLTPNFFICYPQRTNPYTGELEKRQKHVIWCPNDSHTLGEIKEKEYDQVITGFEFGTDFGDIKITSGMLGDEFESIETKKTHTRMQVAMIEIGNALKFQTYIARNDQSIQVGNNKLGDMKGVVKSLEEVPILYTKESKKAAALIDCIWFTADFKFIPAVIEVEHSTGVTSGFTRMLKLRETVPSINTNFTVVAPDSLRNKVVREANNLVYKQMKGRFMPYSTVWELYGLIKKYPLDDVIKRNFIEPFMEKVAEAKSE